MRITSHKILQERYRYLIEFRKGEGAFYLYNFSTMPDPVYKKELPSYILCDSEGLGVNKCSEMVLCKIKFALREL